TNNHTLTLHDALPIYFKQIIWDLDGDSHMAPDRFYAWANPEVFNQLEIAKAQGKFADAPYGPHPGATRSYKQVEFGEANVQLTRSEEHTSELQYLAYL